MKKFIYELFYSTDVGDVFQTDYPCGMFTSLPEVRKFIAAQGYPVEYYTCRRHTTNPTANEKTFTWWNVKL